MRNHVEKNRQVVITCEYSSILDKYRQLLLDNNIRGLQSIEVFDAKQCKDRNDRKLLLDRFSNPNSDISVLLVSSTIGNAGISFGSAYELINLQVSWKLQVEEQMSYRLSSSIITNNEKKYVTWLVTDLHEFVRLINLEICNEQAMLCGLGFEQLADDREYDDWLCVPSFVTSRLRNENETALRAFLKNFFELCFENDDVDKVSRGQHTRFEMDAATMRRLLNKTEVSDNVIPQTTFERRRRSRKSKNINNK